MGLVSEERLRALTAAEGMEASFVQAIKSHRGLCMRRGGRFEVHQIADAGEEPICSSCLSLLIPALLLQAWGVLYDFTNDCKYLWHHTGGHCLSCSSCHALNRIAALHLSGCHRKLETSQKSRSQTRNLWPAWLIDTCPNPPPLSCCHCISNA